MVTEKYKMLKKLKPIINDRSLNFSLNEQEDFDWKSIWIVYFVLANHGHVLPFFVLDCCPRFHSPPRGIPSCASIKI